MGGKSRGPLTEPMFYVLMAFLHGEMCGIDVADFVEKKTRGRVKLGPGTLYTLLNKFQDEALIEEIDVEGRKRTYRLTAKGREAYEEELERLRACLRDAEEEEVLSKNGSPVPCGILPDFRTGSMSRPGRAMLWRSGRGSGSSAG